MKENDGIVIYTRELKGLGVKQVKAEMVLRTSLSSLVALVKRGDLYVDWSYQCTESYLLGEINDSIQFGYTKLDVPWPVHDRDIVYKLKISQNKETGVVRRIRDGVRLIGNNQLKSKIQIKVTSATKSASESVTKAGGTIALSRKDSSEDTDKNKNTIDGDND